MTERTLLRKVQVLWRDQLRLSQSGLPLRESLDAAGQATAYKTVLDILQKKAGKK